MTLTTNNKEGKRSLTSNRGETIAETIIALSILAIGITLSSTIMATSLRNINTSKSRVIAVNIAREGVEIMRNIRDTNWLKYSGRRRECWNHMPKASLDQCSGAGGEDLISPGDYIAYKDEDHRWRLKEPDVRTDGGGNVTFDNSVLYTVDIDPTKNTDTEGGRDLNSTNDADMYNHKIDPNDNLIGNDALGRKYAQATNFKRVIIVEYLKDSPDPAPSNVIRTSADWTAASQDDLNRMRITSRVSWIRGDNEYDVELKTNLTDYLGRESLNN